MKPQFNKPLNLNSTTHKLSLSPTSKIPQIQSARSTSSQALPKTSSSNTIASARLKPQVDYSSMGTIPIVIKDQEYIKRKQTFGTFLRMRDLELMLGVNHTQDKATTIDRHTSLNNVSVLHSKLKNELRAKLRNKEGKMYANELWSMDYYTSIINKSDLKKKFDHISNLRYKPLTEKAQEIEDLFKRRMEKNTEDDGKAAFNSYREFSTLPSVAQQLETDPSQRMHTAQSMKMLPKSKPSVLKSFFKNVTPIDTHNLMSKESVPFSALSATTTSGFGTRTFFDEKEGRYHKVKPMMENSREEERRGSLITSVFPSEMTSPCESPLISAKFPKHKKSITSTMSTNFSITSTKKKSGLSSFFEGQSPDTAKRMKKLSIDLSASGFRNPSFVAKTTTDDRAQGPLEEEENDDQRRVRLLIQQCDNLNQENKELEREVKEKRNGLASKKKRVKTLSQDTGALEIADSLKRQALLRRKVKV